MKYRHKRLKKDLEEKVKSIFGDVCDSVYVSVIYITATQKESRVEAFKAESILAELNNDEDPDFEIDHIELTVKFINGKFVMFSASEWAFIRSISDLKQI